MAAARRGLLGEQLPQVVVLLRRVAGAALLSVVVAAARPLAAAAAALLGAALLLAPPVRWQRCRGDEEVDAAALELRVRRHDDELLGGAAGRAGGGPRRGERVVGVRGEHGGSGHRAAELVDVPAEVHDADDVEGAAGDHAGQAAPQAVAHVAVAVVVVAGGGGARPLGVGTAGAGAPLIGVAVAGDWNSDWKEFLAMMGVAEALRVYIASAPSGSGPGWGSYHAAISKS